VRSAVDGYVAAVYPPEQPRHIVLATRHNATGAQTASIVKQLAL
jgi:hypothetical protein